MSYFTEDRIVEGKTLEQMRSPLNDALRADFREGWLYSPMSSIGRWLDIEQERLGDPTGIGAEFGDEALGFRPRSELVPADAARQRIKDEGLDLKVPDDGIREGVLDILIQRKAEERKRRDIMDRAPPTWGIRTATSFAAGMLDPLNIASAFIPVVGPTRYAAMLARAGGPVGRAGVRAGVGAVEGAVGAALVEPFVLAAASQEQADYTAADSLLNIVFGTVLGGGLHVAVGGLGGGVDWRTAQAPEVPRTLNEQASRQVADLPIEVREQAMRSAIAQMVEGRPVDVLPIIDLPEVRAMAEVARLRTQDAEIGEFLAGLTVPENAAGAAETLARLGEVERRLADPAITPEERRTLARRRDEILTDTTPETLRETAAPMELRRQAEAQRAAIAEQLAGLRAGAEGRAVESVMTPRMQLAAEMRAVARSQETPAGGALIDQRLRSDFYGPERPPGSPVTRAEATPEIRPAPPVSEPRPSEPARATPEDRAISDLAERAAADQTPVAQAAADALAAAEVDLQRSIDVGLISKDDPELRALENLTDRAEAEARAYEAAAFCLRRNS